MGVFAEEAQALDPDYAPDTVNTDGWPPTQGAWKALFEHVTLILCVLHAFLKIRDRTTQALGEVSQAVHQRVWEAYHTPSKRAFSQRLRRASLQRRKGAQRMGRGRVTGLHDEKSYAGFVRQTGAVYPKL
ncbi:MAG: hypothetical protein OEU26_13025 [Candidatus Tectomicrobia bacterium]|nr:hypothetical protein [Candidatus Tectomicrobia bacterium]